MPRYFLALLPPEDLQEVINGVKQQFAEQYQSRKALNAPPHITLQAPFEWPTSPAQDNPSITALVQGLTEFSNCRASVPVQLSGFGAFPPGVIYVQVQPTPELLTLHTQLHAYCAQAWHISDPRTQHRAFTPHITVAFRDLTRANFRASWPLFQDRVFDDSFVASALTILQHNGQQWEAFAQTPFSS
ncbi:2'-5' RNA ligase family protein [Acaryochloris sp. IP29b_bin.148]|uniref:2'-5' RNA ligase family protein n=1 Tax=Acaryochloris sp. IP29b_bin.148 TaxID=2969218 RepID=UPI002639E92B|nr:2'-5' RNA ligase family protein [Acaryochloris sp. IP29b_bin.148]